MCVYNDIKSIDKCWIGVRFWGSNGKLIEHIKHKNIKFENMQTFLN